MPRRKNERERLKFFPFIVLGFGILILICIFSELRDTCNQARVLVNSRKALLLSFYFPQFHPIPENNRFWGANFTEWSNLRRHKDIASVYHEVTSPSPELGYYSLLDVNIRAKQAELANQHNIDGFIYYHYWFHGKPVMDGVLNALLVDGQPNVSFALCWANEHWTKRWDGGDNEVLLSQEYQQGDTEAHYLFLRRFWRHPLHVRHANGAIPFFIYRISAQNSGALSDLVAKWREWMERDGLGRLHLVELLGVSHHDAVVPWADAVGEFWPLYKNVKAKRRRTECQHRCHYPGTFVAWNNSPRHVLDGKATWIFQTPSAFGSSLRAAIRRSASVPPDCLRMVLISSWNEWGEGNVLEPDEIRGKQRLREVAAAVRDTSYPSVTPELSTCVVARTYAGHLTDPFYNVSAFVRSLQSTSAHWHLILVPTDAKDSLPGLTAQLSEMFAYDMRIRVVSPPANLQSNYDSCLSAYHITDWAIRQCDASSEWVIATNADNTYGSKSFDLLRSVAPDVDMLILAAQSRYHRWNYFRHKIKHLPDCRPFPPKDEIQRARTETPHPRMTDIGQVVLRYRRVISDEVYFSSAYPHVCQAEDSATFERLVASGWKYLTAPLTANKNAYLMHNPNPDSCNRLGGAWRDSADFSRFTCVTKLEAPRPNLSSSSLGPFSCAVDFLPSWGHTPSIHPTASNIAAAKIVAAALLTQADLCGVQFDTSYYASLSGVTEREALFHWELVGFISGRPYRWYRTKKWKALTWASDSCFLLRAISGRYVIRGQSGDQCWAQPSRVFGEKSALREVCMRTGQRSGSKWCWDVNSCFEDNCSGCIHAPSADPYMAYTCGFATNRYWIVGPDGMLCSNRE